MSSSNSLQGIILSNSFNNSIIEYITIINSIYLSKKYKLKWLFLNNTFENLPKIINIEDEKVENTPPKNLIPNQFKTINSDMMLYLSNHLGEEQQQIINYEEYKRLFSYFYPSIMSQKIINENPRTSIDNLEFTLYSHIICKDIIQPNKLPKNPLIPINLYLKLMRDMNFQKLVLISDEESNLYLNTLRKQLELIDKELVIITGNEMDNFTIIKNAKYILLDLSLFSWAAHMTSSKNQIVFVWDSFFTHFLSKTEMNEKYDENIIKYPINKNLSIVKFSQQDIKNNYCPFTLNNYIKIGNWSANAQEIKLTFLYNTASYFTWTNPQKYIDIKRTLQLFYQNFIMENDKIKNLDMKRKIALVLSGDKNLDNQFIQKNQYSDTNIEQIIVNYYQELKKLDWDIDIINLSNSQDMINKINQSGYSFIHIHSDSLFQYISSLTVPYIGITSHYTSINKKEKHIIDNYNDILKFQITNPQCYNFLKYDKDKSFLIQCGARKESLYQLYYGASSNHIKFEEVSQFKNKTLCLGNITIYNKQNLLVNIAEENGIDFIGLPEDPDFMYHSSSYLGEWNIMTQYENMTKYPNLVYLNTNDANPLVIKEAMMAGCGIVCNSCAAESFNFENFPKWVSVIPENYENDIHYIKKIILENREASLKHRPDIRHYAMQNFSYQKMISHYSEFLFNLIKPKLKIAILGTSLPSESKDYDIKLENIISTYFSKLKELSYDAYYINDFNNKNSYVADMIQRVNELKPDLVIIMFDARIDLISYLDCKRIWYYPHNSLIVDIMNNQKHPYFHNVFKKIIMHKDKINKLMLPSELMIPSFTKFGFPENKCLTLPYPINHIDIKWFQEPRYKNKTLCVADINDNERQRLLLLIDNVYLIGLIKDYSFPTEHQRYLGHWTDKQLKEQLTHYSNVILLSKTATAPIILKYAMAAGCGIVISSACRANLDTKKPWITLLEENRINDIEYVKKMIETNSTMCHGIRDSIRTYAKNEFQWNYIFQEKFLKYI
tara:strand:+ start:7787 stop:10807 length:3021 start_codon:yes stop_codon:yes gene_type:complete